MSEEELKLWFWNKFNNCYAVKHIDHPDCIFWFYDEAYIRKIKLCKINKQEVILPSKVSGNCLFEQDSTTNQLYCDYDKIWNVFEHKYSTNYLASYTKIQSIIKCWLEENEKLSIFTPTFFLSVVYSLLEETDKLSILTK